MVQGRLTFEAVGGQYHGLLGGREAVLIASRDASYAPGGPYAKLDFQMPYLRHIMEFLGITTIHEVVAEPLSPAAPDVAAAALAAAVERARQLGRELGTRLG